MKKIIVGLLLGVNITLFAQFTGGKGDGYSSAEQSIISTGLEINKQSFLIYPNNLKSGENFEIGIEQVEKLVLVDVIGNEYVVSNISNGRYAIPENIVSGKYSVLAIAKNGIYRGSIVVYE